MGEADAATPTIEMTARDESERLLYRGSPPDARSDGTEQA
jgi:hypothetical protein